ncbi:RNA-directed DNA polymerase from mobile element jockey [Trichonephila clavipes]|uniref:RNA-directed DNA polymerase from mobile element jockey n=1 Tax=Trichonephila clavipes TaxID=2585209 RepID=A0A8X7BHG8_TRICX|nr:RNA-directed DNA polymerase from mobile element jockey [Trichonephila clavipes]
MKSLVYETSVNTDEELVARISAAAGAMLRQRIISKFEATGCLDDRPRSGRPSTRRNAAETVKDEMETVAGSSMHGEVSARAVAPAFHTLLFGWHLGVPSDAIRTKNPSAS